MMDKNNFSLLPLSSKEDCLENVERKICNAVNIRRKLDVLKNVNDENFNQVEENIHENFNKLRKLLNEREDILLKKLKKYLHQNQVMIKKEEDKINDKLEFLYSCQKGLENNEIISTEYDTFCEEYGSCLAVPRYQLSIKEHLKSEIKKCGSLRPLDILLLNVDVLDDDDDFADINCAEYRCKNQSEFEDAEIIDTNSVSSSSSSSAVIIFPQDEKNAALEENEGIYDSVLPLELPPLKHEELHEKFRCKILKMTKIDEGKNSQESGDSSSQSISLGKGLFSHLIEKGEDNEVTPKGSVDISSLVDRLRKQCGTCCPNKYRSGEDKEEEADVALLGSNDYILHLNARIKNVLGNVKTCRKECLAQREIDTFCNKIHIML
ncbi:repetitive organellar protein-like isoform X2 [Centruroides vittatus]